MIGGDEDQVERAMGLFEAMGNTITHVGKQGAGQTVKLVNQILVVGNCLAMCEALIFAQAGGVDLEKCLNAVTGGAAGSWMLANRGPQIIDRDWRPGFTINLQQKDVRLIMQEADALGVPVLLSGQVLQPLSHAPAGRAGRGGQPRARQGARESERPAGGLTAQNARRFLRSLHAGPQTGAFRLPRSPGGAANGEWLTETVP